ncbi:hypothetical protein [Parasynechococcus sp.]|jgi:hypothetical protein|uniref:hypothetical protein n=1 Tax=Parasynechococcus sp. TaxID=3101203 RepID=UPI003704CEB4
MSQSASQAKGADSRRNPPRRSSVQRRSPKRSPDNSDVLVSAVISTYLLTHLHHVLQRAEFGAVQDGRQSQAANYAQLRKVLCLDARSMDQASALGQRDDTFDQAA